MSKYKTPWVNYSMNEDFWREVFVGRTITKVAAGQSKAVDHGATAPVGDVIELHLDTPEVVYLRGNPGFFVMDGTAEPPEPFVGRKILEVVFDQVGICRLLAEDSFIELEPVGPGRLHICDGAQSLEEVVAAFAEVINRPGDEAGKLDMVCYTSYQDVMYTGEVAAAMRRAGVESDPEVERRMNERKKIEFATAAGPKMEAPPIWPTVFPLTSARPFECRDPAKEAMQRVIDAGLVREATDEEIEPAVAKVAEEIRETVDAAYVEAIEKGFERFAAERARPGFFEDPLAPENLVYKAPMADPNDRIRGIPASQVFIDEAAEWVTIGVDPAAGPDWTVEATIQDGKVVATKEIEHDTSGRSGTLDAPQVTEGYVRLCRTCKEPMLVQTWSSSDGGHEDTKYSCPNGHIEWVDGCDS